MSTGSKTAMGALFCSLVLSASLAQPASSSESANSLRPTSQESHRRLKSLTKDDRSTLLAVARDSKRLRYRGHDCSHLVHAIYQQAGFPYRYADSEELYVGVRSFQRVSRPQAGDLVVWHGHVGIVTGPSQHAFFSFLTRGPGIDDYKSRYWRGRGQPRFYRYLKIDSCDGCTVASRTD